MEVPVRKPRFIKRFLTNKKANSDSLNNSVDSEICLSPRNLSTICLTHESETDYISLQGSECPRKLPVIEEQDSVNICPNKPPKLNMTIKISLLIAVGVLGSLAYKKFMQIRVNT